jgi:hypothetical protein
VPHFFRVIRRVSAMPKVYLETSFISYLTSRLSRDLIVAGHQQITQEWWDTRRFSFELYTSKLVIDEATAGHEEAAQKRLDVLQKIPLLEFTDEVLTLSEQLLTKGPFPEIAAGDALHVAVATVHGMDFLLTWNCRHIANAEIARQATAVCNAKGYDIPRICTPEELMGG